MATTIKYGISNRTERNFSPSHTIRDLLTDRGLMASLNAPEGVVAVSGGETLNPDSLTSQYSSITLEKQASSKA